VKTNAIRIHEHGGPEVLRWEEVTLPGLEPGQALLRQTAVGLNFIDVYCRDGLYRPESLPFVPGMEGAGVITAGRGVDVVYDGVGKATFDRSLQCLKEQGLTVSFGNASGPVPPVELFKLVDRTLYLARPSLRAFLKRPGFLEAASRDLFEAVRSEALQLPAIRRRRLRHAAEAHRDLESRGTVGMAVLVPADQTADELREEVST
jgi:NADPH:quinone reductase-like Zn-dependent oxidoreductase